MCYSDYICKAVELQKLVTSKSLSYDTIDTIPMRDIICTTFRHATIGSVIHHNTLSKCTPNQPRILPLWRVDILSHATKMLSKALIRNLGKCSSRLYLNSVTRDTMPRLCHAKQDFAMPSKTHSLSEVFPCLLPDVNFFQHSHQHEATSSCSPLSFHDADNCAIWLIICHSVISWPKVWQGRVFCPWQFWADYHFVMTKVDTVARCTRIMILSLVIWNSILYTIYTQTVYLYALYSSKYGILER
jgi:hypothetical protein